MKRQWVSVADCWQLQTAGKGNAVGQQPLEYFAVRNTMGIVVAVLFFISLFSTWGHIYAFTSFYFFIGLQLQAVSEFTRYSAFYACQIPFVCYPENCFCPLSGLLLLKNPTKQKDSKQNHLDHQLIIYRCGHKPVPYLS